MRRRRKREVHLSNQLLRVGSIVSGGSALARLEDGRVCLVALAAPGELLEARIEREHGDFVEAVVERVVDASKDRVTPRCEYFGECGGCQLQHLDYPAQLIAKRSIVIEQLERIGRFSNVQVEPTVGMDSPWGYRNHVRFSTGRKFGDVGFVRRNGRGLMRIDACPIADGKVNGFLGEIQGKGRGLHQVQIRHGRQADSTLVYPRIEGVDFATGQTAYRERLGGHDFAVSASSFFQVNPEQAEKLVNLVGELLPDQGGLLVDAYAGVGTFAVIYADRFERVIAIEESATAIADAEQNVAGRANVEVVAGKVEHVLPEIASAPDVVILDPARPGCAPPVLEAILASKPSTVVYVSCNPSTLARDLRVLVDGNYQLGPVTPLDMFPHTAHIECVTRLSPRA